jgi:hypothetical protein
MTWHEELAFGLSIAAIAIASASFLVVWLGAARLNALEAKPPEPEKPKPTPTRVLIKTQTGSTVEYGTNLQHLANGQLLMMSGDKLCAIFATGYWRSAQAVPEPPVEAKKKEPVAPNPSNQV